MLRLTEAEIVSILGPEEHYSAQEIATLVLDLQAEARAEIKETAETAAAEAVKPVLVVLAGVTAERDASVRQLAGARVVEVLLGLLAFLGWIIAAVT